jgi:hypothetical protein
MCPCENYEYKVVYTTTEGKCQQKYCPFCGSLIDELEMEIDTDE